MVEAEARLSSQGGGKGLPSYGFGYRSCGSSFIGPSPAKMPYAPVLGKLWAGVSRLAPKSPRKSRICAVEHPERKGNSRPHHRSAAAQPVTRATGKEPRQREREVRSLRQRLELGRAACDQRLRVSKFPSRSLIATIMAETLTGARRNALSPALAAPTPQSPPRTPARPASHGPVWCCRRSPKPEFLPR
jgi:hypothetical protein